MLPDFVVGPINWSVFKDSVLDEYGNVLVPAEAIEEAVKIALTMPDVARTLLNTAKLSYPLQPDPSSQVARTNDLFSPAQKNLKPKAFHLDLETFNKLLSQPIAGSPSKKRKADSQENTMDQVSPPSPKRMKSDEVTVSPALPEKMELAKVLPAISNGHESPLKRQTDSPEMTSDEVTASPSLPEEMQLREPALLCDDLLGFCGDLRERLKDLDFRELLQIFERKSKILKDGRLKNNSPEKTYWADLLKTAEPFIISFVEKFSANELLEMVKTNQLACLDPQMFNKIFEVAIDKLPEMTPEECINFLLFIADGVEKKLNHKGLFAEYVLLNKDVITPACLIRLLYTLVENEYLNLSFYENFLEKMRKSVHVMFPEKCFQAAYIFAKNGYKKVDAFNDFFRQIRTKVRPGKSVRGSQEVQGFVKKYIETHFPKGEVKWPLESVSE